MVFQFGELLPELNVAENVSLPLRLRGERPDDALVQGMLEAVGLGRPGAWPAQLSGGEMQRAAVARALVTRPAVLLCGGLYRMVPKRRGCQRTLPPPLAFQ